MVIVSTIKLYMNFRQTVQWGAFAIVFSVTNIAIWKIILGLGLVIGLDGEVLAILLWS